MDTICFFDFCCSLKSLAILSVLQAANPNIPTYYTNRALCFLKLERWDLAVQDCYRAIEIEPNLIKAHFFLGRALTELHNYDDAIASLIKGVFQALTIEVCTLLLP